MRKNRLLKQSLAVLLSLSMSLGPCAPGSFVAFADTAGVSSEVETDTVEAVTDTKEEVDPKADVEVSEEKSEEASGDSVAAGEEASNDDAGEVSEDGASNQDAEEPGAGESDAEGEEAGGSGEEGGSTLEDHNDGAEDGEKVPGDEDDSEDGSGDEVTSSGEENKDRTASETDPENEGNTSASDQEEESIVPEESGSKEDSAGTEEDPGAAVEESKASKTEEAEKADAASETAKAKEETEDAAEYDETETEGEVRNSEDRHVLRAEVDETIISVIYDDGVFPENVKLDIQKVDEDSAEQEEIREKLEKALKEKELPEIKEEESAEETEDENKETVREESTGGWLSAFEIRVLDENGEAVEPDTEKGEVFVRFEGISVPKEDAIFGGDDITVFGLEKTADDKVKELEKVVDSEGEDFSMTAEGAVVDDVCGEEGIEKNSGEPHFLNITVYANQLGLFIFTVDTGVEELLRQNMLENNDTIYWGIGSDYRLVISAEPVEDTSVDGGQFESYISFGWSSPAPWNRYREEIEDIVIDCIHEKIRPLYLSYWFSGCNRTQSIDLSGLDTKRSESMCGMFRGCENLTSIDLTLFDTRQVSNMSSMFSDCTNLSSLDLTSFDTSQVTTMNGMFYGCSSLSTLDLSSFNTSQVKTMEQMFDWCHSLNNLNLSTFNTSNVGVMSAMFRKCDNLTTLDLTSFDTSQVTLMGSMFYGCSQLNTIYADSWNTEKVKYDDQMFTGCILLKGDQGTVYDSSKINSEFAHLDSGPENPGYFSRKEDPIDPPPIYPLIHLSTSPEIVYNSEIGYTNKELTLNMDLNASEYMVDTLYENLTVSILLPDGLSFSKDDTLDTTRDFSFGTVLLQGGERRELQVPVFINTNDHRNRFRIESWISADGREPAEEEKWLDVKDIDTSCKIYYKNDGIDTYERFNHDLAYYDANTKSTEYNATLALMLMTLSSSIYNENDIRRSLSGMGFEIPESDKYFYYYDANAWNEEDENSVAYAITKKAASDGTTIIPVILRGSSGDILYLKENGYKSISNLYGGLFEYDLKMSDDWYGNFSFRNEPGPHYSFNYAADKVYEALEDYLADIGSNNYKIVITGHSRAAAVGNLLAYKLRNAGYSKDSVYAYNFACPDSARQKLAAFNPDSTWGSYVTGEENEGRYDNIFNICNIKDPVGQIPGDIFTLYADVMEHLSGAREHYFWGKYGRTYYFSEDWTRRSGTHITFAYHDSEKYIEIMARLSEEDTFKTRFMAAKQIHEGIDDFGASEGTLLVFYCPVDITIIDSSGEEIVKVINGEPLVKKDYADKVLINIVDDEKQIFIFGDDSYTVKMTGTDAGTMDYGVYKIGSEQLSYIQKKEFIDVQLFDEKQMISEVNQEETYESIPLYVVDENNNPVSIVAEDGAETPVDTIPVTKIELDQDELNLDAGKSHKLTALISPTYATNKNVIWSSSNNDVATVDSDGTVTAYKAGTVTITATTEDGEKTASCLVTVKASDTYAVTFDYGKKVVYEQDGRYCYFSKDGFTSYANTLEEALEKASQTETYQVVRGEKVEQNPHYHDYPEIIDGTLQMINGWVSDTGEVLKNTYDYIPTSDVVFHAKWTSDLYKVTFDFGKKLIYECKQYGRVDYCYYDERGSLCESSYLDYAQKNASQKIVYYAAHGEKLDRKIYYYNNLTEVNGQQRNMISWIGDTGETVPLDGISDYIPSEDTVFHIQWDTNPVEVFIRRLYTTCLSREADAGGLKYWKGRISSGNLKGIGLASEFVFSKEFKSKNYCNKHFVKQIYPALMGREPDAGGLDYWVGQLDSGKMNRESLLNSFTSSDEYKNLCTEAGIELGATMKVPEYGVLPYGPCAVCGDETKVVQFAERMYTVCLGRVAETGGLAYWSEGLYKQTITGKSILEFFFLSDEIKGKNLTNREYVRRIYKAMLDRDPDSGGWNYWEGQLNSGASPTAVIAGFIDSKEFTGICNDYGIKRK